jgi:hypothetical protein
MPIRPSLSQALSTSYTWETWQLVATTELRAEWKEVLCNEKLNRPMLNRIAKALQRIGYLQDPLLTYPKMDTSLKQALMRFQRDNFLAIGNTDMETLTALGVSH